MPIFLNLTLQDKEKFLAKQAERKLGTGWWGQVYRSVDGSHTRT